MTQEQKKEPKEISINLQELGHATGACGYVLKGLKETAKIIPTLNAPDKQRKKLLMIVNDLISATEVSGGFLYKTFNDFKKSNEPEKQTEKQPEQKQDEAGVPVQC